MMLSNRLKFGFNILNALRSVREAVTAPRKHLKSLFEPAGLEYSVQTNLTAEGFDEVSSEWQAHFAGNPYDLQTYNYLENAQLNNFGTVDNPNVVFTADAPFRFVGCSGPQNEDDYESHELMWIMLSSDEHDRILTDPAYRIQRKSETDLKAKIYVLAMEEYEKEKEINNPWREPLSKLEYENLIQAEVIIRKLDRQFRQLTKFHARNFANPDGKLSFEYILKMAEGSGVRITEKVAKAIVTIGRIFERNLRLIFQALEKKVAEMQGKEAKGAEYSRESFYWDVGDIDKLIHRDRYTPLYTTEERLNEGMFAGLAKRGGELFLDD
ncbi:unnamed protein product [Sphagnum balticum]